MKKKMALDLTMKMTDTPRSSIATRNKSNALVLLTREKENNLQHKTGCPKS
jgi:exopolysaccharide biosynthesis predicted pyruvyltransferase EpsI